MCASPASSAKATCSSPRRCLTAVSSSTWRGSFRARDTRIVVHDGGEDRLARSRANGWPRWAMTTCSCSPAARGPGRQPGYPLYKGVNLPSKTFGELVEHVYDTPRVSVVRARRDAQARRRRGGPRRPARERVHKMSIPTAICCPNGELALSRRRDRANPNTTIVVNCAGRTRSILGAQTLRQFRRAQPGVRAGERHPGLVPRRPHARARRRRRYPAIAPSADLPALQAQARRWPSAMACAMSTPPRSRAGSTDAEPHTCSCATCARPKNSQRARLPGAQHTPGGQLIQVDRPIRRRAQRAHRRVRFRSGAGSGVRQLAEANGSRGQCPAPRCRGQSDRTVWTAAQAPGFAHARAFWPCWHSCAVAACSICAQARPIAARMSTARSGAIRARRRLLCRGRQTDRAARGRCAHRPARRHRSARRGCDRCAAGRR